MQKTRDLAHMHFIVVVLGFTAILGKLITQGALVIVFWRMIFAVLGLAIYILYQKKNFKLDGKALLRFFLIGVVVAIHWITFFSAIKLSNVSVTLVVLSSTTLFTSLLEPLFFKRKISSLQFLLSIAIIAGISLIFTFEFSYAKGIIVALISSVLASLFTVLNKKYATNYDPSVVSFYELSSGWLTVIVFSVLTGKDPLLLELPDLQNFIWLIILGVVCTSYAYTASVKVMRSLSAYMVNLTVNMEPIYGILLGLAIFRESEMMTSGFYFGAAIILLSVFVYPVIRRIKIKREALLE